ncbi:hypothetical protein OK074_6461, partial [Actinobacteria bacterium OK074]
APREQGRPGGPRPAPRGPPPPPRRRAPPPPPPPRPRPAPPAVPAARDVSPLLAPPPATREHNFDRHWRNARTRPPVARPPPLNEALRAAPLGSHDPVAYKLREVGDHFLNGTHPAFTLYA